MENNTAQLNYTADQINQLLNKADNLEAIIQQEVIPVQIIDWDEKEENINGN